MPALILQIISFIKLAVTVAPQAEEIYAEGKALINNLFAAGLITAEQQNKLMAWADAHQTAVLSGQTPPELDVANL